MWEIFIYFLATIGAISITLYTVTFMSVYKYIKNQGKK
jgi:hypothetical protein